MDHIGYSTERTKKKKKTIYNKYECIYVKCNIIINGGYKTTEEYANE